MIRVSSLLLPLLLAIFSACSQEEQVTDNRKVIIATIDNQGITETSFQRTYLPILLYGDKFDSEETRDEVLNYLIGQRLLAQVARTAQLDTSLHIQRMHDRIQQQAMSRQLYQKWVRDKLEYPTEQDLRTGFARGQKAIFTRHLFADSESEIRDYALRLKNGSETFYTLAQDVFSDTLLSRSGGALGWITFGDLDETLEDTVYNLQPGRISEPVRSQYGWHILAIDDTQEELFITEDDFQKNRDLIQKKIIERRENVLGKQVINDFMQQFKIEFNREITMQVWPLVKERLESTDLSSLNTTESNGTGPSLESLHSETLLSVNGEDWSVLEILDRLPELNRAVLQGNLYVAASNLIRNEMLGREAKRLDLDRHPAVLEEVGDHQDQLLADTYVNLIADTLVFTESDLRTYYKTHQLDRYHAPDSLLVDLFVFSDSTTALKALYQLRNGIITTNPSDDQRWVTAADQDTPLYQLAKRISTGTMGGPVLFQQNWTLVKLLKRHRFPLDYAKVEKRMREDMENERFSSTRTILLAEIRPKHQIEINVELLNR
ncbi:MAG: peptidylprolyl isomerase [Candidatus Marinimicrobia bacterium]|nr:peptidylprolyl isomerase [Candidatus Neomarinimicrobiota bacterium]